MFYELQHQDKWSDTIFLLTHVDVEYEGDPNLQTGVAHMISTLN